MSSTLVHLSSQANKLYLTGIVGSAYNVSIPGLKVPGNFPSGPATIQAVITQFIGVYNEPSLKTWSWSVNISDVTSLDHLVYASDSGVNTTSCTL
jgi:hypothetical protein